MNEEAGSIPMGRTLYGAGAVHLGAVELAFGGFSADWIAVPSRLPGYAILLYGSAAWLIVAGAAINAPRFAAVAGAALAALFAGWMLAVHVPAAFEHPATWGGWQAIAESVAMAVGGLLALTSRFERAARWGFAACLLVFGVSHFVYAKLTASLVPAWLPPSRLFWAYATGTAQIAAGLALFTGVRARLAAILLTVMYVVFALLVHLPSILADPASHANWAENAINLILIGTAWSMADRLRSGSGLHPR